MKAIILAAGYATRLYPLTIDKPKALLPVNGKPIINYIVDQLENIDAIDELIVVSNAKFFPHFQKWCQETSSILDITVVNDETTDDSNKLGAIGDISYTIETLGIDDEILVMAGDNIFTFELKDFYDKYKEVGTDMILVKDLESIDDLKRMANVSCNSDGFVVEMVEKPENPKTRTAAFASYIYRKDTLPLIRQYLDEGNNPDAPGFFPSWLYKMKPVYAYHFDGDCYDIGTPESYREVNEIFENM